MVKNKNLYNDHIGKKYHAWSTQISPEHISNKYLGIINYIGKRDSIINPFIVETPTGEKIFASTIDFFSDVNEQPFLWLK